MATTAEDVDRKFRAAWEVFALTCGDAVANEATFQAWFAHYVISQFGIDRVAREPDIGLRHLTVDRSRFPGNQIRIDLVVGRRPGVHMSHRAGLDDRSGVSRIGELAVITELKVASTQGGGLDYTEVCRDFWKLSMILKELDAQGIEAPLAFVGVLDNHASKRFSFEHLLERRLATERPDPRVQLLRWSPAAS
jgi:hypothetical protein